MEKEILQTPCSLDIKQQESSVFREKVLIYLLLDHLLMAGIVCFLGRHKYMEQLVKQTSKRVGDVVHQTTVIESKKVHYGWVRRGIKRSY